MVLLFAIGCSADPARDARQPCADGACATEGPDAVVFTYDDRNAGHTDLEVLGDWSGDGVPELLISAERADDATNRIADGAALGEGRYEEYATLLIGTLEEQSAEVTHLGDVRGDGGDALAVWSSLEYGAVVRIHACEAAAGMKRLEGCDAGLSMAAWDPWYFVDIEPAGDQDGDPGVELLVAVVDPLEERAEVWVVPGVSDVAGDLEAAATARLGVSAGRSLSGARDVDGDGVADVLATGIDRTLLFLGPLREDRGLLDADTSLGQDGRADLTPDLDGDGLADAALEREGDLRLVSLAAGGTTFAVLAEARSVSAGGDLDGDGVADLLAFSRSEPKQLCAWTGPFAGTVVRDDAARCFGDATAPYVAFPDGDDADDVLAALHVGSEGTVDTYDVGWWAGGP